MIQPNIILVSVGILQTYILNNIEQLLQLGCKSIHIITEKEDFAHFPIHNYIH